MCLNLPEFSIHSSMSFSNSSQDASYEKGGVGIEQCLKYSYSNNLDTWASHVYLSKVSQL